MEVSATLDEGSLENIYRRNQIKDYILPSIRSLHRFIQKYILNIYHIAKMCFLIIIANDEVYFGCIFNTMLFKGSSIWNDQQTLSGILPDIGKLNYLGPTARVTPLNKSPLFAVLYFSRWCCSQTCNLITANHIVCFADIARSL